MSQGHTGTQTILLFPVIWGLGGMVHTKVSAVDGENDPPAAVPRFQKPLLICSMAAGKSGRKVERQRAGQAQAAIAAAALIWQGFYLC